MSAVQASEPIGSGCRAENPPRPLGGLLLHGATAPRRHRATLAEHGHTVPPSTARFRTPADVMAFLAPEANPEIKSAC